MRNLMSTFIVLFFATKSPAQISPPGLGHSKTASWFAAGFKQKLNEKWQSMTYFGMGRTSGNSLNPIEKPAILVFNQEFYHQLKKQSEIFFCIKFERSERNNSV